MINYLNKTIILYVYVFFFSGNNLFAQQDPDAYDTSISWRQPVIDYTLWLETSEDEPVETFVDEEWRGPAR